MQRILSMFSKISKFQVFHNNEIIKIVTGSHESIFVVKQRHPSRCLCHGDRTIASHCRRVFTAFAPFRFPIVSTYL